MDESVAASEDPLKEIREQLEALYTDTRSRAEDILEQIAAIEQDHSDTLGSYAEFWLLLAVGHKLADPLPVYGHKSSKYYDRAYTCAEVCEVHSGEHYAEMQRKYLTLQVTQLRARANRSGAQMNRLEAYKYHRAADSTQLLIERLEHMLTSTS